MTTTKNWIHEWAKNWGYSSLYSGNTKTMYIDGISHELLAIVKEEWEITHKFPFEIVANY